MAHSRRLTASLITLLLGLLLARQPAAGAQQNLLVWSEVAGVASTTQLNDVFMARKDLVYTVGQNGDRGVVTLMIREDQGWDIPVQNVFSAPLYAVVYTPGSGMWAVGDKSTLVRWKDALAWEWRIPGREANLRTLQMFGDGEEGWAAGAFGDERSPDAEIALFHYKNGEWRRDETLQGRGYISKVHFTSATSGWAVGSGIWRYDGIRWVSEPFMSPCNPTTPCEFRLKAVRAINGEEAWAAGEYGSPASCQPCTTSQILFARSADGWRFAYAEFSAPEGAADRRFTGLGFAGRSRLVVGSYTLGGADPRRRPVLLSGNTPWNGEWYQPPLPLDLGEPRAVSLLDEEHAVVVGGNGMILAYGYGAQPHPAEPVPQPTEPGVRYFPEVGHTLRGVFNRYWRSNGGLPVFGYPLTEEFKELGDETGVALPVQYFERQRFEHHPEHADTVYEVLLGRLGAETLQRQGRDWQSFPKADPAAPHYYPQTGHAIAPQFWDYWRSHGLEFGDAGVSEREALALFGYPISEPALETNSSGDTVLTQWFERARFEYHPDNADPYKVLLGRLAADLLADRGW